MHKDVMHGNRIDSVDMLNRQEIQEKRFIRRLLQQCVKPVIVSLMHGNIRPSL